MSADPQTRPGAPLASVDEHLESVFAELAALEPFEQLLSDAQGTLLAQDVVAPVALPPYDQATTDGYAVKIADVYRATQDEPVVLPVVATAPRGSATVQDGLAVRVVAGRPLPAGTEAVVPNEWTAPTDAADAAPRVSVLRAPISGAFLRRTGDDVSQGARALAAGTLLGPVQIAMLASLGFVRATTHPRPRVVVFSTGAALLESGETFHSGHAYDGVSHALAAACREAGANAFRLPTVRNTADALIPTLEDHLIQADAVLISGAVAAAGGDILLDVLERLGDITVRQVAMDPGGVQVAGWIGPGRTPVFVVPAAPVAALVSFEIFVRPALRRLFGATTTQRPQVPVALTREIASTRGRRHYVRAQVRHDPEKGYLAAPIGVGLQTLTSLAAANALVVVPESTEHVEAGEHLPAILLERRAS